MKILLTGGGGQLAQELQPTLLSLGEVIAVDRTRLDLSQPEIIRQAITEIKPNLVVNAGAYTAVDKAESEPELAHAVNGIAPGILAEECEKLGSTLIHISTDYVFDGTLNRPYSETDATHPLGAYAVSKLAGELYAQAYLDALVIRVSGVFGPGGVSTARGNFPEMMLRLAKSGQTIRVVEDHVASPSFAPAIASRTADLIALKQTGVFHIGGGEAISWYNWAKLIFESANVNAELKPTNEREYRTAARRPKFSALSNAKLESVGVKPMPPLAETLAQYWASRPVKT